MVTDGDVNIKDRVFLHTDGDGKWYVVRPFDLRQALLPYDDPILSIRHYVGKSEEKDVYVIDSRSKDPSTKPAYAHRLLNKSSMRACRASLEKCNKFPCLLDLISFYILNAYMIDTRA